MTIDHLYETFELIDDWEERYRIIIDLGKSLPSFPDEARTEQNRVPGCISQVWMIAQSDPEHPEAYQILADSDAHIVKGLIAILLMLYSGKTAEEIAEVDVQEVFQNLDLENHLSPNRRNGFYSMVERIRQLAQAPAQSS